MDCSAAPGQVQSPSFEGRSPWQGADGCGVDVTRRLSLSAGAHRHSDATHGGSLSLPGSPRGGSLPSPPAVPGGTLHRASYGALPRGSPM